MALPTPARGWFRELERPFQMFDGSFDDYELYQEDDEFVVMIDMPGFEIDEITVAWDDGVLNVAAEHTDDDGHAKTYHRRFRFPKDVDEDAIAATYHNGVLEVTLPLTGESAVPGTEIPLEG